MRYSEYQGISPLRTNSAVEHKWKYRKKIIHTDSAEEASWPEYVERRFTYMARKALAHVFISHRRNFPASTAGYSYSVVTQRKYRDGRCVDTLLVKQAALQHMAHHMDTEESAGLFARSSISHLTNVPVCCACAYIIVPFSSPPLPPAYHYSMQESKHPPSPSKTANLGGVKGF